MRERAFQKAQQLSGHRMDMERDAAGDAAAMARQSAGDTAAADRAAADRAHEGGLVYDAFPDENLDMQLVTRGGQVVSTGVRAATGAQQSGTDDGTGMSVGEKRAWDAAVEANTTNSLQGEMVNWDGVADDLREKYPDLARMASRQQTAVQDTGSPEWAQAQEMADAWIAENTTMLGRDRTELADFGGSRTQARLAKTQEFYRQLTGQSGAPTQPAGGTSGGTPRGAGTEASPYEPTTQEEYDAMPSGAIFRDPEDGQLYRKD